MPNAEELARYVAANQDVFAAEERAKGKNYLVPPPPKPGEIMICQHCGKPMMPEDFSKNEKIRRHEFKWHLHWACEQALLDLVDRQTPGLLAERKSGINIGRPVTLGRPGQNPNH